MYTCNRCKKNFDRKSNYDQHLNRMKKCKIIKSIGGSKTNKKITHKCPKCNAGFTRKYSVVRHLQVCKNNINNEINGNKNLNNIGNFNNLASKSENCNNININLIVFAKDGIKNISTKDLAEMLKSNKNIIESIISNVNLNPDKPQHHNICYSDIKSSYGEVYENKKWIKKKIDEIINVLVDAKIEDLNEILNDMNDFLNENTKKKIKEAIEIVDYRKPGARKKLISYLKPLLYNHKEMIIKTRKLTKEQEEDFFRKEHEKAECEEEEAEYEEEESEYEEEESKCEELNQQFTKQQKNKKNIKKTKKLIYEENESDSDLGKNE
jgi:hypothetical protein